MSFSNEEIILLQQIHDTSSKAIRFEGYRPNLQFTDFWPVDSRVPFCLDTKHIYGNCLVYAIEYMSQCMEAGFKVRLIHVRFDNRIEHCICEVMDADDQDMFYLDSSSRLIVTRQQYHRHFMFLAASPWNPTLKDHRPWLPVDQEITITP
jgi:hypothetical protein